MITAGVLLRLADDGLLDLDAPIADAVAWGSGNPDITPAQLVSNSSGLVGLGPEPTYAPYLCQFLPDNELEACGEIGCGSLLHAKLVAAGRRIFSRLHRLGGAPRERRGAGAEISGGQSGR